MAGKGMKAPLAKKPTKGLYGTAKSKGGSSILVSPSKAARKI